MPTFGKIYDSIEIAYENRAGQKCTLRIAPIGTPAHRDATLHAKKPYKRKADRDELSGTEELEILCGGMAAAVLLGWDEEQMSAAVGERYPYSIKNAKALLMDDMNFRSWVLAIASEKALFEADEVGELAEKL